MRAVRSLIMIYLSRIGAYQADALLALVYWSVVSLTKAVLVVVRKRLLPDSFGTGRSHWIQRPPAPRDAASMSRQY